MPCVIAFISRTALHSVLCFPLWRNWLQHTEFLAWHSVEPVQASLSSWIQRLRLRKFVQKWPHTLRRRAYPLNCCLPRLTWRALRTLGRLAVGNNADSV